MIKINAKHLKKLENVLKLYQEKAYPYATRSAINSYAFEAQKIIRARLKKDFILRNKFTDKSIRVTKTSSLNVDEQQSKVGSIASYMLIQEKGGIKNKKGKHGVALPTSFSAGLSEAAKPRTKVPKSRFKMRNIQLKYKRHLYSSRKQANAVAIKQSLKFGDKFVYLEIKNKKGIYYITGSAKTLKINKLKMIYDLSHEVVRIPGVRWMKESIDELRPKMPKIYFKALRFQINKWHLNKKI